MSKNEKFSNSLILDKKLNLINRTGRKIFL